MSKTALIYSVSCFIWGLGGFFWGAKPTKGPTWRRDWADCGQKSNKPQIILFVVQAFVNECSS